MWTTQMLSELSDIGAELRQDSGYDGTDYVAIPVGYKVEIEIYETYVSDTAKGFQINIASWDDTNAYDSDEIATVAAGPFVEPVIRAIVQTATDA